FMERLQNDYLSLGDYDEDTWKYRGFYYTPDEKLMSAAELAESDNAFVELLIKAVAREQRRNIDTPKARAEAMALWHFPVFSDCGDKFVTVRYYSVKNKRYEYLPQAICMKLYRSNGMCAGNTPEEALVQGLSELFERYVTMKIVREGVRLPIIPDWYLSKYERLYKVIKGIEENGRYKVLVKDGSLGKGYPVVVLVIIDRERQSYGVRLGAHPEFEIALERTLSEAFQGKTIEVFTSLSSLRFDSAGIQLADNILNIAKIGLGQYPVELFSEAGDYEFALFADVTGKSNSDLLKDMVGMIISQGYDVLIKDASYLGFPSYHVISPGFSEINEVSLLKVLEAKYSLMMKKTFRNLYEASDDELREVVRYIKYKQNSLNENTLSTMIGVDFKKKYHGEGNEHYFLAGVCSYKLENYKEAAVVFKSVANNMSNPDHRIYYRCISDYAAAMAENKPLQEIEELLQLFYPADVVQEVCEKMEKPGEVIEKFYPKIKCFSCSDCGAADNCSYSSAKSIKRALKDRQTIARLKDLQELDI
ncbi:MAG: YcaO-like family protein, partial [Caulobacteraceae bacterium]